MWPQDSGGDHSRHAYRHTTRPAYGETTTARVTGVYTQQIRCPGPSRVYLFSNSPLRPPPRMHLSRHCPNIMHATDRTSRSRPYGQSSRTRLSKACPRLSLPPPQLSRRLYTWPGATAAIHHRRFCLPTESVSRCRRYMKESSVSNQTSLPCQGMQSLLVERNDCNTGVGGAWRTSRKTIQGGLRRVCIRHLLQLFFRRTRRRRNNISSNKSNRLIRTTQTLQLSAVVSLCRTLSQQTTSPRQRPSSRTRSHRQQGFGVLSHQPVRVTAAARSLTWLETRKIAISRSCVRLGGRLGSTCRRCQPVQGRFDSVHYCALELQIHQQVARKQGTG